MWINFDRITLNEITLKVISLTHLTQNDSDYVFFKIQN